MKLHTRIGGVLANKGEGIITVGTRERFYGEQKLSSLAAVNRGGRSGSI
jgi:hypothetical protein